MIQWARHIFGTNLLTALCRCAAEDNRLSPSCHGDDGDVVVVVVVVVVLVVLAC